MIGSGHMLRMRFTALLAIGLAVVAACSVAWVPASAATADTSAEVLPDLDEAAPGGVILSQSGGIWRLGFSSRVDNVGEGPLQIHGTGPGDQTMVADQIVSLD